MNLARLLCASLASLSMLASSWAAGYPTKPVELVVAYQPGGGSDNTARAIADAVHPIFPQSVYVVNKPGASGSIGWSYVATGPADGYRLVLMTPEMLVVPLMGIGKTTVDEFQPIARFTDDPSSITVRADAPWHTIQEFLAYAKANPGRVAISNAGNGTVPHMAAAALGESVDIAFTHVPYQGSAPAIVDLIGGQLDFMVVDTTAIAHVESGQLKLLAITNPERSAQLPDTPTIAEAGVPGYETINWYGLFLPAKTSPEIVQALNQVIQKVLADPSTQSRFKTLRADLPPALDSEAFTEFVRADTRKWDALVKSLNLSLD